jgi:hypothetical protein
MATVKDFREVLANCSYEHDVYWPGGERLVAGRDTIQLGVAAASTVRKHEDH